jgi:predicted nucleic acid-binding protein
VLLVDTNIWLETVDAKNTNYQRCVDVLRLNVGRLITPVTVIIETAWLIEDRIGPTAEAAFLRTVTTPETVTIIDLTTSDWARVIELIGTYRDLGLGTVDASIIAVAERLGITTIATMNQRDFRVVNPAHAPAFELVP